LDKIPKNELVLKQLLTMAGYHQKDIQWMKN